MLVPTGAGGRFAPQGALLGPQDAHLFTSSITAPPNSALSRDESSSQAAVHASTDADAHPQLPEVKAPKCAEEEGDL